MASSAAADVAPLRFESFLQLPTVLQHIVWSFAPRRSLLKYNALCREIRANTASVVSHTIARSPSITQKSMGEWIMRLESLCEAMRRRVLSDPALQTTEFALLFVSRVPPKTAVDPLAIIPGRRAYTGDDQAPQERALRELRRLSLHAPAASAATACSSYSPPLPSIPILRSYNVQDSLASTALRDLPDAAVSKIMTKVRWVLSSWRALWAASLQERQRQEMDRREAAHEEKLNAGLPSDHDYCEVQDQFARETAVKEQEWEEECADLLFELRYVLLALLSYSAASQSALSSTGGGDSAAPSASAASAASALVYTRELVNINDPDQTGQDTEEGVPGGRYTTLLWVLPQVKSKAQEAAEAEVAAALERQRLKDREQAEESERVREMLQRQEWRHKHGPSSKPVTPAVLSPEEMLERAIAERDALRAFAAFKGEPEPTELREKLEQNIREATVAKHQADKAKQMAAAAAAEAAAAAAAQSAESGQEFLLPSERTSDAASPNPPPSTASASARVLAREGFDLPFFMIATTQFRDEKRANNSRRAMQLR